MDFRFLQARLIAHIQDRVRNGEVTQRSLARLSGISQPHIHNVLKGARSLSPEVADQILRCLRIDLQDLVAAGEVCPRGGLLYRTVPFLEGSIGPEHPYPARESRQEGYPFLAAEVDGLESPVAVRLAPDARMADLFTGGDVVLLDRSETRRLDPDEEGYYALDMGGASAVRRVRLGGRQLYPLVRSPWNDERWSPSISLFERSLLQLVQGRVAKLVRRL
jgi:transcriptional regulator with XRE-family HTH domain